MHPDLTPATETLARVVTGIGDDQLGAPTPCRGMTVADVLDHVDGLCLAFTWAAAKNPDAWPPGAGRRRVAAATGLADAHTWPPGASRGRLAR